MAGKHFEEQRRFEMGFRARWAIAAVVCGLAAVGAGAQATGDSRTVTEPTFPAVCTVLTAQQAIVNDAPANETLYDTSRIQAALTACPSGQAVELSGGGGNYAFLSASLNLPSGVSLIVDGGVTLYASRKASDYQVSGSSETCGSYGANGNACKYFFTFNNGSSNTGCGIYGYGVIDLRGGSTILSSTGADTGIKWWTNSDTATTAGQSQDNVSLMKPNKSTNLTLYKITLRNSPQFHIVTSNVNGETVWGVKIQAPYTAHNTDGIDPQGTNITINNTSISEGDDAIAVSGSSTSSNISVLNTTIYSSHGVSIGSYTQGGVSNMLVKNVNMAGEPADGNQNGIRIKSSLDRGGNVNNISYQNMCLRDIYRPLYITPLYNSNSGTSYPNYTNILLQNIHVLPTTKTTKYYASVAGIDANHLTTVTLNNVVFDQLAGYSPAFSYSTIALAGNVYPSSLQSQSGTGVTYTGSATATATPAYDCSATATVFPFIVGEMYLSTATANNLQAATVSSGTSVTLNAMVQPGKAQVGFSGTVGNYTGAAALTAAVNFYEGSNLVGTGTLGANSTNNSLATLTLTGVTAGTHTYTAQYPGDSNYNSLTFGSVTVTVTGATTSTTTALNVTGTLTYGATQTLSATVSPSAATGSVAFYDGTTSLGGCTLSSGGCAVNVVLGGGSGHSITAVYSGDSTYKTSTSTAKTLTIATAASTTAVTANPTTVSVNATTSLSVTVTGVSGAAVPSGTVAFMDGTTSLGNTTLDGTGKATFTATMTTLGAHTVTASYLGDANYAASSGTAAVQVNAITTTTTLNVAPNPAVYGTAAVLMATISPSSATGIVNFLDGSTNVGSGTLSGGVATASVKLPGGSHSLTASYAGDASGTYAASVSTPAVLLQVSQAMPGLSVTVNPTSIGAYASSTVTVTATGISGMSSPTGTVLVSDDNGVTLTLGLTNGVGSGLFQFTSVASHHLTASYPGDANYAATTAMTTLTVTQAQSTTTLTVSTPGTALTVYPGGHLGLSAGVSVPNTSDAGATVTFYQGNSSLGTATVSSGGSAALTTANAPTMLGTYTYTATTASYGAVAGSTSNTGTITVVAPWSVTATTPVSVAAGGSGSSAITVTPGGGYSGTITATCTSPVSYITCIPASSTVVFQSNTSPAVTTSVTIAVAATTGAFHGGSRGLEWAALLGLLGACGVRSKKRLSRTLALLLMAGGIVGMSGCGGGTASTSGTGSTGGTKPAGSQTLTYTLTNSLGTTSTSIVVNIQ